MLCSDFIILSLVADSRDLLAYIWHGLFISINASISISLRYVTLKGYISLFSRVHGIFYHWPSCAFGSVINTLKPGVKMTTVGSMRPAPPTGRSQIPWCTCLISHKSPFRIEISVFNGVSCVIWDRCFVVFVRFVYWCLHVTFPKIILSEQRRGRRGRFWQRDLFSTVVGVGFARDSGQAITPDTAWCHGNEIVRVSHSKHKSSQIRGQFTFVMPLLCPEWPLDSSECHQALDLWGPSH